MCQFSLIFSKLGNESTIWVNLDISINTIWRLDFTKLNASMNVFSVCFIKQAITRLTLLDTPAIQCTSTFVLFLYSSMNLFASQKQQLRSNDSWSTAGMYRYSMCGGIILSRFRPLMAVITAYMACSLIVKRLLLSVKGFSAASTLLIQMPPRPLFGSTIHCISSGKVCMKKRTIINIIILLMENLPPIHEMYASLQEQKDYDVIRKYQTTRVDNPTKKSPTKKGSYLDDAIKMSSSPGPANKSNGQLTWVQPNKQLVKYSDRKTYVDQIQALTKKRNSPSPNHYNIQMEWPDRSNKVTHVSQKINFLDHSQFESIQTPGPGTYLISTNIAKRVKDYHYTQTKPLQTRKQTSADMNTYEPIPVSYPTFKRYEKEKGKGRVVKKQEQGKKQRQNMSPGPGHYQMIHTWEGKDKRLGKGSLTYLSKISKGPTPNVYYH